MCIIAYIPRGVDMPPRDTLRTCYTNNPDGAGFAYVRDGAVRIVKGLMTFEAFEAELSASLAATPTSASPYVLHFRITTQGGTRPANCHPFPADSRIKRLKQTRATARLAIAHNGVIAAYSKYNPAATTSDTMDFISDYAAPLLADDVKWYNGTRGKALRKALDVVCGGRLAILGADAHCEMIGNFVNDGGVYYSNTSYKPRAVYTCNSYGTSYTYNGTRFTFSDGAWHKKPVKELPPRDKWTPQSCPVWQGEASFRECNGCQYYDVCFYGIDEEVDYR